MGLAAPKNRIKISNDPQNTNWANNTSRFGHRMLTAQGWQPGSSLGAKDASHAAHYTAASQSHIRVFLKDDNLGLGAKRGSERAENFGLAGLESILGRLNGNEAAVKKEEERREEIEKRAFVYRKYGMMNFVSGGFLVGDKITKKSDVKNEIEVKTETEIKSEPQSDDGAVSSKDKKRKREERDEEEPKLKRKKKSTDLRDDGKTESDSSKSKKDKKDKSKKSKRAASSDAEAAADTEPMTDKARRKAEKKARKEEKKAKKALKKAAKKAAKKDSSDDSSSESETEESTPASSVPVSGASTPAPAGLTYNPRGMHAVRQRWIRQKKAATMDAQAMKEIFMIKTPS